MRIAVDIMGGDLGPEPLVKGCIKFVQNTDTNIVIVGNEYIINKILDSKKNVNKNKIEIAHTTQYVKMEDKVSKVLRRKKLASISIAARLVKTGYCNGLFTVGNTAAVISWSNVVLKKIKGVKKSALCSALPNPKGLTLLIDAGASIRCTGENLTQFAEMGNIIAKVFLKKENPKIGLLNIAKEEGKGKFKIQRAHHHLSKCSLNYVGYIEGNDLASNKIDIAVCDGFVGNVILKYSEALLKQYKNNSVKDKLIKMLKVMFGDSAKFIKSLNGAPLLGVNGAVVVGHGASSQEDFESGLNITKAFIKSGIVAKIKECFT